MNEIEKRLRLERKEITCLGQQNNDLAVRHAALLVQNVQQEKEIENLERQVCEVKDLPHEQNSTYNELLFAVCRKFPNESRRETAL